MAQLQMIVTILLRPDKYNKVTEMCQESCARVKEIKPYTGAKNGTLKSLVFGGASFFFPGSQETRGLSKKVTCIRGRVAQWPRGPVAEFNIC